MLSLLQCLPWLSSLTVLTSSAPAIDPVLPGPTSVVSPADTGGAQDSLVLLTPALVTSYVATEKALAAYWAAHPDQAKQARDHGDTVLHVDPPNKLETPGNKGTTVTISIDVDGGVTTDDHFILPDYPRVVQQDTAVAAIFTNAHLSPAQFAPIARSVDRAIAAVLQQKAAGATVMGQNMAFVQAHRPELAVDWSAVQSATMQNDNLKKMILDRFKDQINNMTGQGTNLEP